MAIISGIRVHDIRFPTSLQADGSDAMNKDGDYSAAYLVLETDSDLRGHGFTFTIGRGNDLCAEAARQRAEPLIGRDVDSLLDDLGGIYRELAADSQLRWLGPEKGVVHLAMAAVMNALWDMAARRAGVPLWRLHEHFVDPVIVSNGHYVLPSNPGYSAELREDSIQQYEFPTGSYWLDRSANEVLVSR